MVNIFENLSQEEEIILKMSLVERSYEDLKEQIRIYENNRGPFKMYLENCGLINEPPRIILYRESIKIHEIIQSFIIESGLSRKIT